MRWVDGFSVCPIDDSVTSSYEEARRGIERLDPNSHGTRKEQPNGRKQPNRGEDGRRGASYP
jgi:hypothetical protein